jgi:hypothetical protein
MKKTIEWGGKRKGAGRKPDGKAAYNVTLTAKNVERIFVGIALSHDSNLK